MVYKTVYVSKFVLDYGKYDIKNLKINDTHTDILYTKEDGTSSAIIHLNNIPARHELYRVSCRKNKTDLFYNFEVVVAVNIELFEKMIVEGQKIPSRKILMKCVHDMYMMKDRPDFSKLTTKLLNPAKYTKSSMEIPSEVKLNLYNYQKENVKWLHNLEKNRDNLKVSFVKDTFTNIGDIYIDIKNFTMKQFIDNTPLQKTVQFYGGCLVDKMGLGKTMCMLVTCLLNPPNDSVGTSDRLLLNNKIEEVIEEEAPVVDPENTRKLSNKCIQPFKSGKKKDQLCNAKTVIGTEYCPKHNKKVVIIEDDPIEGIDVPEEKQEDTPKVKPAVTNCPYLFKSGKNVGKTCDKSIKNGNPFCSAHMGSAKPKVEKVEEKVKEKEQLEVVIAPPLDISKETNLFVTIKDKKYLNSRATLVVCPNQLCLQWKTEMEKNINKPFRCLLLTKKLEHEKYTYKDFINADFVIVSFNLLENPCYTSAWEDYSFSDAISEKRFKQGLNSMHEEYMTRKDILELKSPMLTFFNFHRLIFDEIHESLQHKDYLRHLLKMFRGNYVHCVTGTPFEENDESETGRNTYFHILQLLTRDKDINSYYNEIANKYIVSNIFRRNTKESVASEFELPGIDEKVYWLKFTDTERAMYDNRLATIKDDYRLDIYLRQLCCHPQLSAETKELLMKCQTLDEIHKVMTQHTKNMIEAKIKEIAETKVELDNITRLHKEALDKVQAGQLNQEVANELGHRKGGITRKFNQAELDLSKMRTGSSFFDNIVPRIKEKEIDDCCVCLCEIDDDDIGITSCGHIYCYSCLTEVYRDIGRCSHCNIKLTEKDVIKIEEKKEVIIKEYVGEDNLHNLISKHGTKMAHIIKYIKKMIKLTDNRAIIFSQWDNLLNFVADTLKQNNINVLSCKGNVMTKNKAIREFEKDENRIITLSSKYSASGTNLTKANIIIFIDPVYGSKEHIQGVELQAIGRAHRLGQNKPVTVVRFLMQQTVEEEIYNHSRNDGVSNDDNTFPYLDLEDLEA